MNPTNPMRFTSRLFVIVFFLFLLVVLPLMASTALAATNRSGPPRHAAIVPPHASTTPSKPPPSQTPTHHPRPGASVVRAHTTKGPVQVNSSESSTPTPNASGNYLYVDDGSSSANSIDVFLIGPNGSLKHIQNVATHGSVVYGVFGANVIAISKSPPCLFHVDNGSNQVESFAINSNGMLTLVSTVTGIGNPPNGSYPGDIHVIGKNVWVAVWNLSGSSQLVSLGIGSGCALKMGNTFTTSGNQLYFTLVPVSTTLLAAVDSNNSAMDMYSLSGNKVIGLVSHTATQLPGAEGGAYGVIGTTGYLFNGAAVTPPQAEAHTIYADELTGFVPGSPASSPNGTYGANVFFDPSPHYLFESDNRGNAVDTYGLVNGKFTFLKTNTLPGSSGPIAQTVLGNEYFVESYASQTVNACAIGVQGVLKCNAAVHLFNSSVSDGIGVYPPLPPPPPPPLAPPLVSRERLGGGNPSELNHALSSAGDQVDTFSGNFSRTYTDFSIAGRGIPLLFSRTYNAQAASINGPLGWGWTDGYNLYLAGDSSGDIFVVQENGSSVDFTYNNGAYIPPPHVLATLTYNGGSQTFTFTRQQDRTRYIFNGSGQLTQEIDRNNYQTNLSYNNSDGTLKQVKDPAGRLLNFSYTTGLMTSITDPTGNTGPRTVSFSYDGNDNLISATDVNGGVTQFTYDANHLLLTITDPSSGVFTNVYDCCNRATSQTDAMGRMTSFNYGSNNTTTITDPNGNVTVDQYNQNAQLETQTKGTVTWKYTYNSSTFGATMITDPNQNAWKNTYDSQGNMLSATDPLGRTTTYTYDSTSDLTSSTGPGVGEFTQFTYDGNGNLKSKSRQIAQSQFQITTYIYGDQQHPGDVTEIIQPNQHGIKKLYCDSNSQHAHPWCYTYDANGDRTSVSDPLRDTTTYQYNGIGWQTTRGSPNGNTTSYTYDKFGDVTLVTDPLGHTTSYVYDANRNLVKVTDGNGHITSYSYDADNERTQVIRADGSVLTYSYDNNGNRTTQTDGLGNTTKYAYGDPAYPGAVTATTDPLNRTSSYSYDSNGNLTSLADPAGKVTSFSYDAANERTGISYSDGQTHIVSFSYNADGKRINMSDGTGNTTYAYDALNRLTSSTTGAGNAVSYSYDLNNNLIGLTYPGGQQVTRTYDAANRLTAVKDWLGKTTVFTYDFDSNLVGESYPNGVVGTRQYDKNDRVTSIVDTMGNNTLLSFTYTRDNQELLASLTTSGTPQGNETYGYTQLNQVSTVNQPAYQYDAADNLIQNGNTTLTYDKANELTSFANGSGSTTFSYDTQGNRTQQTAPGNVVTSYAYDQANRLTAFSVGSTTAQYTYNGDSLRMSKTVGGTPEAFTWDLLEGALLLQDGSTQYVYGPGGIPLEQVNSGAALYYLTDQLGSTRGLTDATGALSDTYAYDAYGNLTGITGSDTNPLQFAGQYNDAESGLIYMRARYYDPGTQQFLTRDPLVSQTQQAYGYAAGDPLNLTDPTGLGWFSNLLSAIGNAISNAVTAITNAVVNIAHFIAHAATVIGHAVMQGLNAGWQWFKTNAHAIGRALEDIGNWVSGIGAVLQWTGSGKVAAAGVALQGIGAIIWGVGWLLTQI